MRVGHCKAYSQFQVVFQDIWSESSWNNRSHGTTVSQERKFLERSLPRNESSTGAKVPRSECSTERKFQCLNYFTNYLFSGILASAAVSLKPDDTTARLHGRPHTLIAVNERVCITVRLCTSMTTHAANVHYCKFSKMPLWWDGQGKDPPCGSDRVRSTSWCRFSKKCPSQLGSGPRLVGRIPAFSFLCTFVPGSKQSTERTFAPVELGKCSLQVPKLLHTVFTTVLLFLGLESCFSGILTIYSVVYWHQLYASTNCSSYSR